MQRVNIVVIGSAAEDAEWMVNEKKGQTPELKDLLKAKKKAERRDIELNLYLIDPLYNYAKYPPLKLNINRQPNDDTFSQMMFDEYNLCQELMGNGVNIIDDQYKNWINDDESADNIFVSYLGKPDINDVYDFMAFIGNINFNNKWYFVKTNYTEKFNITDTFQIYLTDKDKYESDNNIENINGIYNLFKGDKLNDNDENKEHILRHYLDGIKLLIGYIKAGFLKNNADLPEITLYSWFYQTELTILKGIIDYYQIKSNTPGDKTIREEMIHSAGSRKVIARSLCKVISNFVYNNNYITDEDVKKYGWENATLYFIAMKKLL